MWRTLCYLLSLNFIYFYYQTATACLISHISMVQDDPDGNWTFFRTRLGLLVVEWKYSPATRDRASLSPFTHTPPKPPPPLTTSTTAINIQPPGPHLTYYSRSHSCTVARKYNRTHASRTTIITSTVHTATERTPPAHTRITYSVLQRRATPTSLARMQIYLRCICSAHMVSGVSPFLYRSAKLRDVNLDYE